MSNHLADNLKFLRAQSGQSQQEVADRLYVKQTTYSAWENKASEPSIEQLYRIRMWLCIDMEIVLFTALKDNVVLRGSTAIAWLQKHHPIKWSPQCA